MSSAVACGSAVATRPRPSSSYSIAAGKKSKSKKTAKSVKPTPPKAAFFKTPGLVHDPDLPADNPPKKTS